MRGVRGRGFPRATLIGMQIDRAGICTNDLPLEAGLPDQSPSSGWSPGSVPTRDDPIAPDRLRRRASSLYLFATPAYPARMPDDKLTPATAEDVADALAFALRFQGRKRVHDADELMSSMVAKRLVEHLERCGFVLMKKPPIGGSTSSYRS
jgi:hypothetical protein